ncbi:MAG: alpha/beta hydrolase [Chloroflexi bacterium]|nr:alpha/beta hydrolase [Chloroflexota bacterium]
MSDHDRVAPANPQADEGVESLRVRVGDHAIHLRRTGSGSPVLLLHGGANDSSDWVETMSLFSREYSLYAPDLVGYGLSDRKDAGYCLSDFSEATLALIRQLGLSSLSLVGHSLGGRVCLEVAIRHPEMVRRLVLIDTAGFSRLTRLGGFLGMAAWGVRRVLKRPQPYPKIVMENGAYGHWMCLEELPGLRVPTLIVWSHIDPYYPLSGALRAVKLMPQARLEVFSGYGHAPHRADKDRFHGLLREFLSQG